MASTAPSAQLKPRTLTPRAIYLRISLESPTAPAEYVSASGAAGAVSDALVAAYGAAGSARMAVEAVAPGVLRVPAAHHREVWAALTLFCDLRGHPARFVVERASPYLFAVVADA